MKKFWLSLQVDELVKVIATLISIVLTNNHRLGVIEKDMADIKTSFDAMSAAVDALVTEDASVVADIKALQSQIAAGNAVTAEQLDALTAKITGVTADLTTAVAGGAPAPAPVPVPEPTPGA